MKTVNYKGASNRCTSLTDLCTSKLYCSPSGRLLFFSSSPSPCSLSWDWVEHLLLFLRQRILTSTFLLSRKWLKPWEKVIKLFDKETNCYTKLQILNWNGSIIHHVLEDITHVPRSVIRAQISINNFSSSVEISTTIDFFLLFSCFKIC